MQDNIESDNCDMETLCRRVSEVIAIYQDQLPRTEEVSNAMRELFSQVRQNTGIQDLTEQKSNEISLPNYEGDNKLPVPHRYRIIRRGRIK